MVVRSFQKCGISAVVDGTEDEFLWQDEQPEEEGEEESTDEFDES